MNRWSLWAITGAAVIAVFITFVALSRPRFRLAVPSPTVKCPIVRLEPSTLDIGNVEPGTEVKCSVEVANDGDGVLRIANLRTSCGCTTAILADTQLASKQLEWMSVSFRAPIESGEINHLITFDTNDPRRPHVSVPIRGRSSWQVECVPGALEIHGVAPNKDHTECVELVSQASYAFSVRNVSASDDQITVAADERVTEGRRRYRVTVRSNSVGQHCGYVSFTTDSVRRPEIVLPVTFWVEEPSLVSPRQVIISSAHPGEARFVALKIREAPLDFSRDNISLETEDAPSGGLPFRLVSAAIRRIGNSANAVLVTLKIEVPNREGYSRGIITINGLGSDRVVAVPVAALIRAKSQPISSEDVGED